MIKMVQKQDIITLRRREMSLRAIARELKLNRATVTKVVREFEASRQAEDPGVTALERRFKTQKNRQDESWRFGAENETRTMSCNTLIISDLEEAEKTSGET